VISASLIRSGGRRSPLIASAASREILLTYCDGGDRAEYELGTQRRGYRTGERLHTVLCPPTVQAGTPSMPQIVSSQLQCLCAAVGLCAPWTMIVNAAALRLPNLLQ
jgi:hypothetical protein